MKICVGVAVLFHIFLTAALVGNGWSSSVPVYFYPSERATGTYWIAGLDVKEKRKITARVVNRSPFLRSSNP
jgi:hypothetical protein